MKTNVIMIRKMGEFDVLQRTQDGFFDASNLLAQWNSVDSNINREMYKFINSTSTKEFIDALIGEINHNDKMLNGDTQALIYKKGINTKNGRTKDVVWMHPYLFIKFAMWLNPKFEVKVIKFVYDELIKNRHLAGDKYGKLSTAVSRFSNVEYYKVGIALNYIVFNKHHKALRDTATDEQLQELHELEDKLAFAIDNGLIPDYNSLIDTMRNIYQTKNKKF